jgi:RimK family alpha-L-glutamate ligase
MEAAKNLDVDLTVASFSDVNFKSDAENIFVGASDIASFDLIYFRIVGKRLEDATVVANYARQNGIKVVDRVYNDSLLMPSSISKAMEEVKLIKAQIPIPKTIYGSLRYLQKEAPANFGFPVVIKSTTGKKAREVWAPSTEAELSDLVKKLRAMEITGVRFFAQEFVKSSQRYRAFVIGDKVVAVLTQPTKWRKRFASDDGQRGLVEVSEEVKNLAIRAACAADLDVSGVDILKVDETEELLVIEANAAPSWNLVKKYTDIKVEEEIIKWLVKQK